jgi:formylglycine-generating enzyme required for sulfatase activity
MKERLSTIKLVAILVCAAPVACHRGAATPAAPSAPHGPPPEVVSVPEADITLGFFGGPLTTPAKVAAFRLTKYPITVSEFRACVAAGACAEPHGGCATGAGPLDHSTYPDPAALDVPMTCALVTQAKAYCAWIGGRLPTGSEWLLAARGRSVQKYPWGADAPTCERFPIAEGILADARSCCRDIDSCTTNDLVRVGAHHAGASPSGVEDLLFSTGELVDSDPNYSLASCGGGSCVMVGRNGSIEGLVPALPDATSAQTFRCAFAGAKP